jgi:hypothetical protein
MSIRQRLHVLQDNTGHAQVPHCTADYDLENKLMMKSVKGWNAVRNMKRGGE